MTTDSAFVIELAQGSLAIHDLTIGVAADDAPVVLAVHGITANGLSWQRVADEIGRRHGPGAVRVLAPDLRGRGESRDVPGPYGLAAHVDDLVAIATVFGATPLLVGHSMGAFVSALAVATEPSRFRGAVLVDGGLAFPVPESLDVDAALEAVIGPAMQRLTMRFAGADEYLAFWEQHPALGPVLRGPAGDAARRYLLRDLVEAADGSGEWVSSCVLDAARADGADVLADAATHSAVRRAADQGVPLELVWAHRGLLDEAQGLYDDARLAALDVPDEVGVTGADANHYAVILGATGVAAIVDSVDRLLFHSWSPGSALECPPVGG